MLFKYWVLNYYLNALLFLALVMIALTPCKSKAMGEEELEGELKNIPFFQYDLPDKGEEDLMVKVIIISNPRLYSLYEIGIKKERRIQFQTSCLRCEEQLMVPVEGGVFVYNK
ncbi:hypothetical protein [Endozoicomonas sp. Mp262]|uniref:hypothetical protein n=1 Tax=Endozoicomonas sp. Mp262 TaxID=2919499 RepID=UPI0021DB029F